MGLWMEAELATERLDDSGSECLLAVSEKWSLGWMSGNGVRVSRESIMEERTAELAGLDLMRFEVRVDFGDAAAGTTLHGPCPACCALWLLLFRTSISYGFCRPEREK